MIGVILVQNTIIEVNAESYQDCMAGYYGGADRVVLCSALNMGGLTPSIATLIKVKKEMDIEINCLVRPRFAGFSYDECDREIMLLDAKYLLDEGCDGIVFGYLDRKSNIDKEATKEMVELIHSYNAKAIFHRAFDVCDCPYRAIQDLIDCGVDRVMTSGHQVTAPKGKEMIKDLVEKYEDKIEIIACKGIDFSNAQDIIDYTHVKQISTDCTGYMKDPTTQGNYVNYSYLEDEHHSDYGVVCEGLLIKLIEHLL